VRATATNRRKVGNRKAVAMIQAQRVSVKL
jgi:hypothetical protein